MYKKLYIIIIKKLYIIIIKKIASYNNQKKKTNRKDTLLNVYFVLELTTRIAIKINNFGN